MTDYIDVEMIEEDYYGSLDIVVTNTVKSKESIRKELNDDIEKFLENGGKIQYVESQVVLQRSRYVGIVREGMSGVFTGLSRDSV